MLVVVIGYNVDASIWEIRPVYGMCVCLMVASSEPFMYKGTL